MPRSLRKRARAITTIRGSLDTPAEPSLSAGPARFEGWALADKGAPKAVEVLLNGKTRVPAQIGGVRPDVPHNLGDITITPTSGWFAIADLATQPPGDLKVEVLARSGDGETQVVADRKFKLRFDDVRGGFDVPVNGAEIEGDYLVVAGWAWSEATVARIEVALDGVVLGRARLGLPRYDISAEMSQLGSATRFEFRSSVGPVFDGLMHEVAVVVIDLQGKSTRLGTMQVRFHEVTLSPADERTVELLQRRNREALGSISNRRSNRDLLVFTHSLELGGGQLYLQDLLREMVPELNHCTVVSPRAGILAEELEMLGIDVIVTGRNLPRDIRDYEGCIRELELLVAGSSCSTVLINTVGEFCAADAAQRVGIPTVWAIHESFGLSDWLALNYGGRVPPYLQGRLQASLCNATRLVFEAESTREIYVGIGVAPEKALALPYGIDIDALDAYVAEFDLDAHRAKNGIATDAFALVCAGTFEERKAQAWLTEAFAHVASVHPSAELILVGDKGGAYSDTVRQIVSHRGLEGRVRTVPVTPDIWEWYAMADVLVSASDIESMPRTMLESMSFGTPVLATSVFGVSELIRDSDNGWLMKPRDMGALIAGLHRVLNMDKKTLQTVGAAARESVHKLHRADAFGERYLKLIDEVEAHVA